MTEDEYDPRPEYVRAIDAAAERLPLPTARDARTMAKFTIGLTWLGTMAAEEGINAEAAGQMLRASIMVMRAFASVPGGIPEGATVGYRVRRGEETIESVLQKAAAELCDDPNCPVHGQKEDKEGGN